MPKIKREKPFHSQLVAINKHVSARKLKGNIRYFELSDLRNVYDTYRGHCCYCGLDLVSESQKFNTAYFMFRIPLEISGAVDTENIVLVCPKCRGNRKPRRPPERPIFGYNAFSDIIVHLVQAVVEKNKEKVKYFKAQLDYGLQDYVQTLYYKPLGLPLRPSENMCQRQLDEIPAFPDSVAVLVEHIAELLDKSHTIKEYGIVRDVDDPKRSS